MRKTLKNIEFTLEQIAQNRQFSSRVFLQLLGIIYLIAFLSALPQLPGLMGTNGVFPIHTTLSQLKGQLGIWAYLSLPSPVWLLPSTGTVEVLCFLGILAALLMVSGNRSFMVLVLPWLSYLSIIKLGNNFFVYFWDILLLEAGFLSLFLHIGFFSFRFNVVKKPSKVIVFFFFWLIFRMMLGMGLVKFWQGSTDWQNLGVMQYFYPNQPMPAWPGWYLWQMPEWFHRFSVAFVFFAEIIAPFFIWSGRKMRLIAFMVFSILMGFIFISGNYGFLHLLSIVIFILLLDDKHLKRILPGRILQRIEIYSNGESDKVASKKSFFKVASGGGIQFFKYSTLLLIFITSLFYFYQLLKPRATDYIHESNWVWLDTPAQRSLPKPLLFSLQAVTSWYISNPYALFGVIPHYRMEIEIWGSYDAKKWQQIKFKYKPQEQSIAPQWYEPHHSRLDHAMYYESFRIRDPARHRYMSYFLGKRWMPFFLYKIFTGSKDVSDLLEENPFADRPPRYLRLKHVFYSFTTYKEYTETGNYWHIEPARPGRFFDQPFTISDLNKLP